MPHKNGLAKSLRRVAAIELALRSRDGLHVPHLADELGVDARTIRRHLDDLESLGVPIVKQFRDGLAIHSLDRRSRGVFAAGFAAAIVAATDP